MVANLWWDCTWSNHILLQILPCSWDNTFKSYLQFKVLWPLTPPAVSPIPYRWLRVATYRSVTCYRNKMYSFWWSISQIHGFETKQCLLWIREGFFLGLVDTTPQQSAKYEKHQSAGWWRDPRIDRVSAVSCFRTMYIDDALREVNS